METIKDVFAILFLAVMAFIIVIAYAIYLALAFLNEKAQKGISILISTARRG